tara:strand:- start:172 stop:618 length:447 start_codon:yes stop_codon:yes gene_type:complete
MLVVIKKNMSEVTFKSIGQSVLLWTILMGMNTSPLIFDNYWFNITLLHFIAPVFINRLMKGGAFFGYASLDFPSLILISFFAFLFAILVSQIFDKKIQEHYKNYGKDARSTGIVYSLRVTGFIIGMICAYPFVTREHGLNGYFINSFN